MTKKYIFISISLAIFTFFLGYSARDFLSDQIRPYSLIVEHESHEWNIDNIKDGLDVTAYVRNKTNNPIKGPVKFTITLDPSGLDKSFLTEVIRKAGKENILKKPADSNKYRAIKNYIDRDMNLLDGKYYEPIETPDTEPFKTSIVQDVTIHSGETKIFNLKFTVPPSYIGYRVSIIQE